MALSIEECRQILGETELTDDAILKLRDCLVAVVGAAFAQAQQEQLVGENLGH